MTPAQNANDIKGFTSYAIAETGWMSSCFSHLTKSRYTITLNAKNGKIMKLFIIFQLIQSDDYVQINVVRKNKNAKGRLYEI